MYLHFTTFIFLVWKRPGVFLHLYLKRSGSEACALCMRPRAKRCLALLCLMEIYWLCSSYFCHYPWLSVHLCFVHDVFVAQATRVYTDLIGQYMAFYTICVIGCNALMNDLIVAHEL